MAGHQRIRFEQFVLDLEQQALWRGGERIPLRPKTWTLLCHLIDHPGRLATKAELLDRLWPDTAVNEAALANCVSELRAALADDRSRPRFIESAHRRGYRWIAPLGAAEGEESHTGITVGREAELAALERAGERALSGRRQIVFVTGEAGMGKTTLVEAALARLPSRGRAVGMPVVIGRGQCIEHHGVAEPYLPLLDALSDLCRQAERERVVAALRRCAPTWLAQLPAVATAAERAFPFESGLGREHMLREMGELFDVLAAEICVALCLEDLHWGDHASVDMLAYLARRRGPARLLILATYRPVAVALSDHPLKAVKGDLLARQLCREVSPAFLPEPAVAAYLHERFRGHRFPPELAAVMGERSGGHPFFMVALADFLAARGWIADAGDGWSLAVPPAEIEAAVPETLKQMVERQIDEQAPQSLPLLETASLLGVEFASQALAGALAIDAAAAEEECESLARRQLFLRRCGSSEWPDGTPGSRFAFAHALYRDVLYQRLGAAARRRAHRRAGEALERDWGSRRSEVAAEIASHFDRGGDRERAVRYLREAAAQALHRGGTREAFTSLQRALALLDTAAVTPETSAEIATVSLGLCAVSQSSAGYGDAEAGAALRRALAHGEKLDDDLLRFSAMAGLYGSAFARGRQDEAQELAAALLALSPRVPFAGAAQVGRAFAGVCCFARGALVEARRVLEEALELDAWTGPFMRPRPRIVALTLLGRVHTLLGCPARGAESSRQGIGEAVEMGPIDLAWAHLLDALRTAEVRDAAGTRAAVEQLSQRIDRYGFDFLQPQATILRGWATAEEDPGAVDLAAMRAALEQRRASGREGECAWLGGLLTEALLAADEQGEAERTVEEALATARRTGESWVGADLHRLRGQCAAARGAGDEAEHWYREAVEISRRQGARWFELRALVSHVRLDAHNGRARAAREDLARVLAGCDDGFDAPDLRAARALVG